MGEIVRPVIDPDRLDELREVDAALVGDVAAVWLATTPSMLDRLCAAAAAGDAAELASAAHALRGSSANMGADLLAEACAAVEAAGSAFGDVGAAVSGVRVEHARATAALVEIAASG